MALQNKLRQIGQAFSEIAENCYHYWREEKDLPCVIWAESAEDNSYHSDNQKSEQRIIGTVDLFTRTEFDPLMDQVQETMEAIGLTWFLNSVQFESDINLIHYEWEWGVTFDGEMEEQPTT